MLLRRKGGAGLPTAASQLLFAARRARRGGLLQVADVSKQAFKLHTRLDVDRPGSVRIWSAHEVEALDRA